MRPGAQIGCEADDLVHSQNYAAGQSIIGNVCLNNESVQKKFSELIPEHFLDKFQQRTWRGVRKLDAEGDLINPQTLADTIAVNGDRAPTLAKLEDIAVGAVACGKATVAQLKDTSLKARLAKAVDMIQKRVAGGASAKEIRDDFERIFSALCEKPAQLDVVRGDEVAENPLTWLWKKYLPKGKLVHFGGNSSQAKSPVTVDIAARVSVGAPWPDGTPNEQGPRSVILLNVEDDLQDTILPRFRVAGGDKSRLRYVRGTRVGGGTRSFALDRDMEDLKSLAKSIPDLGLIIVDPVTNYLGSKKMITEEEMRALLTPLAGLAAELGIVVITVGHFNRRERGTDPLHRMMGAAAFTGVARAVYAFGPDPDDKSKYCHVMTVVRSCGGDGPALRYRTDMITEGCPDSYSTEIIKVAWTGVSEATAEEIVDSTSTSSKSQEQEAADVLKELLRDGRRSAEDCTRILKAEGFDLEKLNAGRVRHKAGADSKKHAGEKFYSWFLVDTKIAG